MRKSFNTLGAIVTASMNLSLLSGSGFVFINRRKTHLKMLRLHILTPLTPPL